MGSALVGYCYGWRAACYLLNPKGPYTMIRAAISFLIIALIAAVLGMNNVAVISADLGKTLLFVFLALAVISVLVSLVTGRRAGPPLP